MKKRLYKTLLLCFALAAAFCALYALYYFFKIGVPCLFYTLTGLQCPACGTFRMLSALFTLNFKQAALYNPVMLALLPVILILFSSYAVKYIKYGTKEFTRAQTVLAAITIAVLVIFGLVRNFI